VETSFLRFPSRLAGLGHLLLRVVLAGFLTAEGTRALGASDVANTANRTVVGLVALLLIVCALLVGIGLWSRLVQAVVIAVQTATLTGPLLLGNVPSDAWQARMLEIAVAASLALTGPGAYSVDARLFGRREIKIPGLAPTR